MDKIQKALYDFDATLKKHPEYTKEELLKKFPEFGGSEKKLQSAYDYVSTMNSGKYSDTTEFNHKFPEFFYTPSPLRKNVNKATDNIPDFGKQKYDIENETPITNDEARGMAVTNSVLQDRVSNIAYDTEQKQPPAQISIGRTKRDPILSVIKGINTDPIYETEGKELDRLTSEMDTHQRLGLQTEDLYKQIEEAKKTDTFEDVKTGVSEYMHVGNGAKAFIAEDSGAFKENWKYTAAEQLLNEASDVKNFEAKGFLKDAGGNFLKTVSNPETWDFGFTDANANGALLQTVNRFNNGEKLNHRDEMLLEAAAINTITKGMYAYSRGAKAGQVTGEAMPFMLEFILNPLSGSGSGIASGVAKYALKNLPRLAAKTIGKKAVNIGARVAGDVAASAGMAATSGIMSTVADAEKRMIGDVIAGHNEQGDVNAVGFTNQLQAGEAITKAFGAKTIENLSEMSGAWMGTAKKGATAFIGKVAANTRVGKLANKFLNAPTVKAIRALEGRAQWNGTFGEFAEEQIGTVLNSIFVGDNEISDLTNVDQQIDTFLGVALMGGFMSAAHTVGFAKDKAKAGIMVGTARRSGEKEFGDDWAEIEREIYAIPLSKRKQFLKDTLSNSEMPESSKKALMGYMGALTFSDSLNMTEQDIKNVKYNERLNDIKENGKDGAYIFDKSNKSPNSGTLFAINNSVNEMEEKLGDEFAFMTMEDIVDYLDTTEDLTPERTKEIESYLGQRSVLNGAIEAMEARVEQDTQTAHAEIDATTREDGTRLTITTDEVNGQPGVNYFVVDGQIALDNNGNVLRGESDATLLVRDEKGNLLPNPISINQVGKAAYQDAEQVKQQIADDIRNRYTNQFVQEVETDPIQVKTQDGAEITWFENGKPKQGIVIDRKDGFVRIQEGNKVIVKTEAELTEELKNPTQFNINDELSLWINGVEYKGAITANRDADGKYSVNIPSFPGKKNYELTDDEIVAMQTAPVEPESAPPTDLSTPVEQEITPVEEITPEQQAEQEKQKFIETLPKIKTGNKAGRVDTKKLTPEQAFQYTKVMEGTETAVKDIKDDIFAIDSDIRALEKKLQTTTGTAKIDIREDVKELKERRDNLKTILDREAPGLEAEMKAQAEKKAKIEAEVKAMNEAIAEAQKNRVLTDEERKNLHNNVVSLIKEHNEIPPSHTQKRRAIFNEINKKASQLGYSVNVMRGGQFSVQDKEGKTIRTIAQRTPQEEIDAHPLLTEYAPEFQAFAIKLMQSMPETLDFPNTNVEKGVKDILSGIKTVAANRMLDKMNEMFTNNEVIIRATASTPEVVLSIDDYFALFEPETDNEIHILNEMLQYAPEEFYFEIYDDLITDDNINYINQLFEQYGYEQQQERETRTYPGYKGESTQETIDGNAEESISGQAEELNKRINPEKVTESASVVSPRKKEMQADTDGTGVVGKTTTAGATSLQSQLDTQALDREQEAKAHEEKKTHELSIEEKKADIERRRKDEFIKEDFTENGDFNLSIEIEEAKKWVKNRQGAYNRKPTTRHKINLESTKEYLRYLEENTDVDTAFEAAEREYYNNQPVVDESVHGSKEYAKQMADIYQGIVDLFNDRYRLRHKINAKYDAELEALEEQTKVEVKQPIKKTDKEQASKEDKRTSDETTPNIGESVIEAKKADIERRRQEELKKFGTSENKTSNNSIKVLGINEYVSRELMELAYSNDSGNNPKIGGGGQSLDRIIERGGYSKEELLLLLKPEINKINAKYDAELEALEEQTEVEVEQPIKKTDKEQASKEDKRTGDETTPNIGESVIEAKKADIERRKQEAKENTVPEPASYKEAVEAYKSTDLGSNEDAKRKKQRVVDEAQTKEGRVFVENQVAQLETNDDGTITVYRSGTMQEGHNPATLDKKMAEIIASERKKQGLSSDIIEVRVQPTDISAVIPGIESEVFIKVNDGNKNRISDSTKKPQKTKTQIIKERENVKIELDEVKQSLLQLNKDFKNGKFPFSERVYNDIKKKQEQKIKNLEWQLTKYDAELASLETRNAEQSTQAELDTQELDARILSQAHNNNPTEKQKETGVYDKARINVQGYNITLETLKGQERKGIDSNGKAWAITMNNHYGELDGTIGYDGDAIDVFVGTNPKEGQIFIVDQVTPEGDFDESKVMLGFDTAEQAKAAYMSNYEEGWQGFGSITPAGDKFKAWLYDGKKQRKPFAEYKETPNAVELTEQPTEKQSSVNKIPEQAEAKPDVKNEIPETGLQQSIPVTDSMKQTAMAGMPLYHTGTTMKPATPKEVAATVEQLLKTWLAKEVRMVTPEEIQVLANNKATMLSTPSGVIYGAVKNGIVYINSNTPNLNTPIHEFGHLWIDNIEVNHKALFEKGSELIKETIYWKHVNADPNYSHLSENARIKEAMAMAIGDKGEKTVKNLGLFARLKSWIYDVWEAIGVQFGIHNLRPEQIEKLTFKQFTDIAVSELLSGENLVQDKLNAPLNRLTDTEYIAYESYGKEEALPITEALNKYDIPIAGKVWQQSAETVTPVRTLYNNKNIAYYLYRAAPTYLRELKNSRHLLDLDYKDGVPQINRQKAGKFRDIFNSTITPYVEMLQRTKYLSTEAAQNIINDIISEAAYAKDYYERYAQGEDVWRTQTSPAFQIIGEKGAAALDKAEEATTRLDNLAVAKEMEATKTAKEIRLSTGWERGADSKWRYEILDGEIKKDALKELEKNQFLSNKDVNIGHVTYRKNDNGTYELSMMEKGAKNTNQVVLYSNLSEPELVSIIDNKEVSDKVLSGEGSESIIGTNLDDAKEIKTDFTTFITGASPLNEVFESKELFTAYPELKDVVVVVDKNKGLGASYSIRDGQKVITIGNVTNRTKSTLIHEIQHAIQEIEGFAKGGNEKVGIYLGNKRLNEARYKLNEFIYKNDDKSEAELEKMPEYQILDNDVKIAKLESENGNINYSRLSGEVEARNAQTRMDYTDEQRRNTLLSETAEVAPEDQIFIFEGMGVNMLMSANATQDLADNIKANGLKSVIPNYVDFLKETYDAVSKEARKEIINRSQAYGWDIGRATEEYLANYTNGVLPAELDAVAALAGIETLAPSEIKMAFWDNFNPDDGSIEYKAKRSLAEQNSKDNVIPTFPSVLHVQEAYERIVGGKRKARGKDARTHAAFRIEESYANHLASLRVFMDIIGEVPDKYNPYYLMQLYTSAANTAMDRYEEKEFDTMMKGVTALNKALHATEGLTYLNQDYKSEKGMMNAATVYALAKAGLERNERLARKNASQVMEAEYNKLNKQLLKGDIDQETFEDMQSALATKEMELAERINAMQDFGGLTGLAKLVGSKAEEFEEIKAVIEEIVAEGEKATDTTQFWEDVKKATSFVLKYQYDRGMMTKELYEEILEMEPHYLPLRGYDEKTAGDVYEYFTGFTGEFNPVLKKAKGHEHLPENPFAHIISMTASGVLQAEKNRAKQALLNLVENHENDLVTARNSWIRNVGNEENPEWVNAYPVIPEDSTPEQVTEAINDFEEKMKSLQAEGKALIKTKNLRLGLPIGKGVVAEHAVIVKRNGEEKTLYVNGNPRLAQAINGLLNPDARDYNKWTQLVRSINRGMSANFTSRNLEFALTNSQRDMHMAIALSAIEEGVGYSAKLAANSVVAQRTLASHIFGSGTKGKYQDYLNEFLEAGGQTGFVHVRDIERYGKDIKKYERSMLKKAAVAVPNFLLDQIEDANNFAEMITRFATYITSREEGRTVTRSAVDAKNITLNFNQKGTGELGASIFQNYILFFNPAMQALYRSVQAHKASPAKFWVTMGSHAAAGALLPTITFAMMALVAGGDDDELKKYQDSYWNTPEWIRRNNLMVWNPYTKGWHTLALGQELRWAYSIGETAFTKAMDKEKYGKNAGKEMLGAVTALLPVDMFGASHWYMPGFATPVYESIVNENFMGNPIYKDTPWNKNDPEHSKAYKRTWGNFVEISKKLNEISGGDDVTAGRVNINPAIAQHLVEGYLGGLVSVYLRAGNVASAAFKGEEYSVNDIPFVRRLYKVADTQMVDSSVKREYFDILNDLEKDYGHKELRWRQKNKEYEDRYKLAEKQLKANGEEITPEAINTIFTPDEIKQWQDYQTKYNDIQQSADAYKMQVYKEADKVRKQWEKDGISFSDTDLMLQVLEKVKAIDEAEKENN